MLSLGCLAGICEVFSSVPVACALKTLCKIKGKETTKAANYLFNCSLDNWMNLQKGNRNFDNLLEQEE